MHKNLKFILGMKLCVSDSSSVHRQEFSLYTAMVYVIQVWWQLVSWITMELGSILIL